MRTAYIETITKLTKENPNIYSMVGDNGAIVFDDYRRDFARNFVNFGIAEATMTSVAAGMASCGAIPFIYTIIPFLVMRAYEQIRNDICLQQMNVKIVGIGAGLKYSTLGPTHHAIEDLALMRVLPNITIFSPADAMETRKATELASRLQGPVYLRLGTNREHAVYEQDYSFEFGKAVLLNDGYDVTLMATGDLVWDALMAVKKLSAEGLSVRLLNFHTIKPLDDKQILKAARETKKIITIENHSVIGGLGSAVAEVIAQSHSEAILRRLGINDQFCVAYADYESLKDCYGLSADKIAAATIEFVKQK